MSEVGELASRAWAKLDGGSRHPLTHHMLDSAHVGGLIWDEMVPRRLKEAIGLADAAPWVMWICGIHDIGKAIPGFQAQDPAWTGSRVGNALPHGPAGQYSLAAELDMGFDRSSREVVARVVGGHHGFLSEADAPHGPGRHAFGGDDWRICREELAMFLAGVVGATGAAPRVSNVAGVVLSGLIPLADWLASNAAWFPFGADIPLESYVRVSLERARTAVTALRWSRWEPPSMAFGDRFPFPPRPAQEAVAEVVEELAAPALIVVESQTGSGKTEAALHYVAQASARGWSTGFYVGLPTRATSDQMFGRVKAFLESAGSTGMGGEGGATLSLVHGWASLNSDFQSLLASGPTFPDVEPSGIYESGGAVVAEEWFSRSHRGLVGPIGVGTVDAVLHGGLRKRHGPIRMFGLATKAVVIDEVHAYDAYMETILERVLQWLGLLEVPVILLSATLPSERRAALVEAYAGKSVAPSAPADALVTWADRHGRTGSRRLSGLQSQAVDIDLRADADAGFPVAEVLAAARSGANVLVVRNTVDRARSTARSVLDIAGQVPVWCVHARMPFDMRDERQREIRAAFGPGGARPRGSVVVATQVLEQSLDVDFDVLYTDLAPIDLLVQRIGRVHRHANPRPTGFEVPRMVVVNSDVAPAGRSAVYHVNLQARTLAALTGRTAIRIPTEVGQLIDLVYSADELPAAPWLQQLMAESRSALVQEAAGYEQRARDRWVPHPTNEFAHAHFTRRAETDEAFGTRLESPAVDLVLLGREVGGVLLNEDSSPKVLLRSSLSLSSPGDAVRAVLAESTVRAAWTRRKLLRGFRAVELDGAGRGRLAGVRFELDRETGLEVARE